MLQLRLLEKEKRSRGTLLFPRHRGGGEVGEIQAGVKVANKAFSTSLRVCRRRKQERGGHFMPVGSHVSGRAREALTNKSLPCPIMESSL